MNVQQGLHSKASSMRKITAEQDLSNQVLDVVVVGAGFSGVCMGKNLHDAGINQFVILEKTQGIGGTWYKNTYPGAACDVPSHFYSLSFAPNPDWSHVFSPQSEIQTYIEDCADRFNVTPHIRFGQTAERVVFDEATQLWVLTTEEGETYKCRHLVLGAGGLNTPKIPDLPGLSDFGGDAFHTAQWRHDVALEDKNIVVIGSAASAIQLIPQVAKKAANVAVFQRTPNYILPRMDRAYTDDEKAKFRKSPWRLKLSRLLKFWRFELILTPLTKKETRLRGKVRQLFLNNLKKIIKDTEKVEKLTPEYLLGCKRILISDDFYPSLNQDNVELVTSGLQQIKERSVVDGDGKEHPADVIVLATGFDLKKQMVSIDLVGENGRHLSDVWREEAACYDGAMVPGFPNVYFTTGPNTGVGSTSIVFMIEVQVKFIMKCLRKTGRDKLMSPREDVTQDRYKELQSQLQDTVWASGCESWYMDEKGRIHTLYPKSATNFMRRKIRTNWNDFVISNRLSK
jgi:cation diffusion facilitator CzcD-associated flavoprotein CzcO